MKSQVSSMAKGLAAGMAVGAAATMLGSYGLKNAKRSTRKKLDRAMKSVGSVIDTMSGMVR